jgi:hypothetical protein
MNTTRVFAYIALLSFSAGCAAEPAGGEGRNRPRGTGGFSGNSTGGFGGTDFGGNAGTTGATPPPSEPVAPRGDRQNIVMDECPGTVPAATVTLLQNPALQPGGARWLYPYDQTVFPRGLPAPYLQWGDGPGAANAVLIHMRSMLLDYRVCLPLSNPGNVQIPQAAWDLASEQSLGKGDPLTVDVTIAAGGSAVRLPALTLVFALANLKGAIYYNTYGSLLANQMGVSGGVIMRVLPGEAQPDVFITAPNPFSDCIGCHAVSADGSRMVAEIHGQPGIFEGPSSSFDLTSVGAGTNPPPLPTTLERVGFSALYPDGSVYVTTGRVTQGPLGTENAAFPVGNVPGTFGPAMSKLYDANTGMEIANSGIVEYAYMPMFSVDGSKLVFNQMDASGVAGGHTLAVMDFNRASNTFSNLKSVFTDSARFPGWPFFLPDVQDQGEIVAVRGKRVVFALGEFPDFATQNQPVGLAPHVSDLWWVDIDSGMAAPLARANGTDSNGAPTLPYGERDAHKNYIPTVSPVAAGGYFWVFFTSKRNYGNLFAVDPPETRAEAKKIWVSAIDINAAPGSDPSHPAFFLDGQELESGNIRAFAALEPCRENGTMCDTGIDCCCGFCIDGQCGCRQGCAMLDEKCETSADCCDGRAQCIGGFCSLVVE